MGLGASLLTTVYIGMFDGSNLTGYCWFVSAACAAVGVACWFIVGLPYNPDDVHAAPSPTVAQELHAQLVKDRPAPPAVFLVAFGLLAANVVYLAIIAVLDGLGYIKVLSIGARVALSLIGIALLLSFSSLIGLVGWLLRGGDTAPNDETPLNVAGALEEAGEAKPCDEYAAHCTPYTRSLFQSLQTVDFTMMMVCCCIVWGTGLTVTGNIAQIYRASNGNVYEVDTSTMYVSIAGIGSALGRVGAGLLERRFKHLSITVFLPLPAIINVVGLLLMVVLPAGGLAVPFFVLPAAFGAMWALVILAARMMYRPPRLGVHYGVVFASTIVAVFAFNRGLFGSYYDAEAHRQGLFPHCSGAVCYAVPAYVLAVLNAVAAVAAVVAHRRWSAWNSLSDQTTSPDLGFVDQQ
jgi:hypothetical protein